MATRTTIRHAPRAIACFPCPLLTQQPRRTFLNLLSTEPQNLTARRTLPYAPQPLYDIIADVDRYPSFLPYCQSSRVTKWTSPDANGRRWPTEATLSAGWGTFEETYTSRLFCIPGSIVEAISGDARTPLPPAELANYGLNDTGPLPGDTDGGVFKSLVTRWTVKPLEKPGGNWSEVDLSIKYIFANPLYAAVSSAVADKIAPVMVDAFVKEAQRVLR